MVNALLVDWNFKGVVLGYTEILKVIVCGFNIICLAIENIMLKGLVLGSMKCKIDI